MPTFRDSTFRLVKSERVRIEEAKALSSLFPESELPPSWYVDEAGGCESLTLTDVPVVLGLDERHVVRLAGVLPKSDTSPIVVSWI